ncbi:MAG: 30S ribosomal protein S6 [Alphaproteobacteria bacterium MarineAlpha6_Bin6]|nr:30S ribosomal protein S6 [Pelagibacteraceae bacterium]PPR32176.1 MAG: 30S ribosomal protein S6 [Alphaproteobacteria bacterium MarineAlpha6_Bin6]PPR32748.1 MAG: 30S ribosomal protein S6 [Alphaproteobacteria bacterium MarineAlpha6_Bin5]|tara:strand:+ start:78 stop:422 length:345 start_codon:yes stop_codon:yes gene_type:complete
MSLYELVFIARQEVSPVRAKELAKKINEFIVKKGGKIKKEEYWGFKNLSYQIKKSRRGHYIFFIFDTTATVIHELKTQIKLTQDIIRHMFIKIKEKEFDKNPSEMMKENQDEDR